MAVSFKNSTSEQKRRSLERIDNLRSELDRECERWQLLGGKYYSAANDLSGGFINLDEAIEKVERCELEELIDERTIQN